MQAIMKSTKAVLRIYNTHVPALLLEDVRRDSGNYHNAIRRSRANVHTIRSRRGSNCETVDEEERGGERKENERGASVEGRKGE